MCAHCFININQYYLALGFYFALCHQIKALVVSVNLVNWFEIPVIDINRACDFYSSVFDLKLTQMSFGSLKMASFPSKGGQGATGALVEHKDYYTPSLNGVVIYFSTDDINKNLSLVKRHGGKIIQEKKEIAPNQGFNAVFEDSEGNRIALHAKD